MPTDEINVWMLNWLAIKAVASNHMAICYINTKRQTRGQRQSTAKTRKAQRTHRATHIWAHNKHTDIPIACNTYIYIIIYIYKRCGVGNEWRHCKITKCLPHFSRLIKQLNLITVNMALIAVFPTLSPWQRLARTHMDTAPAPAPAALSQTRSQTI